ncbi:hypothetical protein E4U14_001967 [Claviceps sp. LM454 group G7]|nr:hypothetical protein E4U14_001967 [Claviceps sp. LM454 group G7]
MVSATKNKFETPQNTNVYHLVWNKTNLKNVMAENPTKTKLECVDIVADKLKKVKYGLFDLSMRDKQLRRQMELASEDPDCEWAQPQQSY